MRGEIKKKEITHKHTHTKNRDGYAYKYDEHMHNMSMEGLPMLMAVSPCLCEHAHL